MIRDVRWSLDPERNSHPVGAKELASALRTRLLQGKGPARGEATAVDLVDAIYDATPTTRCASCDRYELGGRWLALEPELPASGALHVVLGMCPDCRARLEPDAA